MGRTQPTLSYPFRHWLLLVMLTVAMAALAARALYLQGVATEKLRAQGDARHQRVIDVVAHRGMILDRNGEPLAVSTPVDSIWAQPRELAASPARWPELAVALGLGEADVARAVERGEGREFVWLRRHLTPDEARAVLDLGVPGVAALREYRRYYPSGPLAGHVIGFTNIDDSGQEGMERVHDRWLAGASGQKRVVRDNRGRIVETIESVRTVEDGRDLVVSIDSRIQYLAFRHLQAAVREHDAQGGSMVVLDARTGEILAMVNEPSFNPNNRADRRSDQFRNRAVTDVLEPGSTLKPFTVAMALASGKFLPDTRIETGPGWMTIGRSTIRDVRDFGLLTVSRVLVKSSNVGTVKIAMEHEPEQLVDVLQRAGFGSPTGSGLPGEVSGSLDTVRRWRPIEHATLSFGYGMSATPLQIARAFTVFANDGELMPVTLEKRSGPVRGERVLPVAIAREVRHMLELAVSTEGTGSGARLAQYTVAGKTGTVRKLAPGGGYAEDRYQALFAGFAPASAPRVVAVVVIDEPAGRAYYGGQVAAPVFSNVVAGALRLMNVTPDAGEAVVRSAMRGAKSGGGT